MYNYKNLKKIIKPEFQSLYNIRKENDKFCVNVIREEKEGLSALLSTPLNILSFFNPDNPLKVMSDSGTTYVSDMSKLYSSDYYRHFVLNDEIIEFLDYLFDTNRSKYEFYQLFGFLFKNDLLGSKSRYIKNLTVRVSDDFSQITYLKASVIRDVYFRVDKPSLKKGESIVNYEYINNIKPYVVEEYIYIDVAKNTVFLEDDDGYKVNEMSFSEFISNLKFNIDDIKERAKDLLHKKINDIDSFKWVTDEKV